MTSQFGQVAAAAADAIDNEDEYGAMGLLKPLLLRLGELDRAGRARSLELLQAALALRSDGKDVAAAGRAARDPDDARALYDLGHALVERSFVELAVGVLRRAVALAPHDPATVHELVAALEREGRYQEAVDALSAAPEEVARHPLSRYLLAFYRAVLGDVTSARELAEPLSANEDARYAFMGQRLRRIVARADVSRGVDVAPSQAGHFIVSASMLVSPSGDAASTRDVRGALDGLLALLTALGLEPGAVWAMADRDSQIVARAIGALLEVPVTTWYSGAQPGLVVAWDLAAALPEQRSDLRRANPGQLLFALVADADAESEVAADILGILAAETTPPWGGGATLDFSLDDDLDEVEVDDRAPDAIATDLASLQGADVAAEGLAALVEAATSLPSDLRPPVLGGAGDRERRWRRAR